jgi:tape measure domain-containing protein
MFFGLSTAAAAFGGVATFIKYSDTLSNIQSKLVLVTNSQTALNKAMTDSKNIALATRTSVTEVSELYAKLSLSAAGLGVTNSQIALVTRSVAQAMTISGAGVAESQAAIMQLGQALSSGILQGDELRSILENSPALARAIADGLHVSFGQLRLLGAAGKLTSEEVFKAILSQTDVLDAKFKKVSVTFGGAFTNLKTSALALFSAVGGASIGGGLASSINNLALFINNVASNFNGIVLNMRVRFFLFAADVLEIADNIGSRIAGLAGGMAQKVSSIFSSFKFPKVTINMIFDDLDKSLNTVMSWIKTVEHGFFWLYDRVIGHSWIPDLVDGVEHFTKKLMGDPLGYVQSFVKRASDMFESLASKVSKMWKGFFNSIKSEAISIPAVAAQATRSGGGWERLPANNAITYSDTGKPKPTDSALSRLGVSNADFARNTTLVDFAMETSKHNNTVVNFLEYIKYGFSKVVSFFDLMVHKSGIDKVLPSEESGSAFTNGNVLNVLMAGAGGLLALRFFGTLSSFSLWGKVWAFAIPGLVAAIYNTFKGIKTVKPPTPALEDTNTFIGKSIETIQMAFHSFKNNIGLRSPSEFIPNPNASPLAAKVPIALQLPSIIAVTGLLVAAVFAAVSSTGVRAALLYAISLAFTGAVGRMSDGNAMNRITTNILTSVLEALKVATDLIFGKNMFGDSIAKTLVQIAKIMLLFQSGRDMLSGMAKNFLTAPARIASGTATHVDKALVDRSISKFDYNNKTISDNLTSALKTARENRTAAYKDAADAKTDWIAARPADRNNTRLDATANAVTASKEVVDNLKKQQKALEANTGALEAQRGSLVKQSDDLKNIISERRAAAKEAVISNTGSVAGVFGTLAGYNIGQEIASGMTDYPGWAKVGVVLASALTGQAIASGIGVSLAAIFLALTKKYGTILLEAATAAAGAVYSAFVGIGATIAAALGISVTAVAAIIGAAISAALAVWWKWDDIKALFTGKIGFVELMIKWKDELISGFNGFIAKLKEWNPFANKDKEAPKQAAPAYSPPPLNETPKTLNEARNRISTVSESLNGAGASKPYMEIPEIVKGVMIKTDVTLHIPPAVNIKEQLRYLLDQQLVLDHKPTSGEANANKIASTTFAPDIDKDKYRSYAASKSKMLGVDPALALAIFQQESGFVPTADAHLHFANSHAYGISQFQPDTAKGMGYSPDDRKDPYKSIDMGVELLKRLTDKFHGDTQSIIAAYHHGENSNILSSGSLDVTKLVGKSYAELRDYLIKVGHNMKGVTVSVFDRIAKSVNDLKPKPITTPTFKETIDSVTKTSDAVVAINEQLKAMGLDLIDNFNGIDVNKLKTLSDQIEAWKAVKESSAKLPDKGASLWSQNEVNTARAAVSATSTNIAADKQSSDTENAIAPFKTSIANVTTASQALLLINNELKSMGLNLVEDFKDLKTSDLSEIVEKISEFKQVAARSRNTPLLSLWSRGLQSDLKSDLASKVKALAAAKEEAEALLNKDHSPEALKAGTAFQDTASSTMISSFQDLAKGKTSVREATNLWVNTFTNGIIDNTVSSFFTALDKGFDITKKIGAKITEQFDFGKMMGETIVSWFSKGVPKVAGDIKAPAPTGILGKAADWLNGAPSSDKLDNKSASDVVWSNGVSDFSTSVQNFSSAIQSMGVGNTSNSMPTGLKQDGTATIETSSSSLFDAATPPAMSIDPASVNSLTTGFDGAGLKDATVVGTDKISSNVLGLNFNTVAGFAGLGMAIAGLSGGNSTMSWIGLAVSAYSAYSSAVKVPAPAVHAATGGYISGEGTGTSDSIPAMLSNGEFVVNAKATKMHFGLLDSINKGSVKKFATGGIVNGLRGFAPVGLIDMPKSHDLSSKRHPTKSSQSVFNINITGDVSSQTRTEIQKMIPMIATGVNMHNYEQGKR